MKQLQWPTIESQKQHWIEKETPKDQNERSETGSAYWQDFIDRAAGYDQNPLRSDWPIPHADIRGLVNLCKKHKANAQRLADALKRAVARLDYLHQQDTFHSKDWDAIEQSAKP